MLMWLAKPIIGYAVLAGLVLAITTGLYFKIKHDGAREALQQVEQEKGDAIKKAQDARERIRTLCDVDPDKCLPDDWFRD